MDSFELKNEFDNELKEFEKAFDTEEIKERPDIFELFSKYKSYIYTIIFYAVGLLCGSFVYQKCQNEVLNKLLSSSNEEFLQLFLNNLSLYMLVFALSVLLGICLVGFPFINIIPLFIGFEAGMKIAFYYINHGIKGAGYSFLMLAPFISLLMTVLTFTASMSYGISKRIYDITVKKSEDTEDFNYKAYLKKYLIYAGFIVLVSLINAAVSTFLQGIISI